LPDFGIKPPPVITFPVKSGLKSGYLVDIGGLGPKRCIIYPSHPCAITAVATPTTLEVNASMKP
jgi:hypothetical protein